jgi:hypothetical protein
MAPHIWSALLIVFCCLAFCDAGPCIDYINYGYQVQTQLYVGGLAPTQVPTAKQALANYLGVGMCQLSVQNKGSCTITTVLNPSCSVAFFNCNIFQVSEAVFEAVHYTSCWIDPNLLVWHCGAGVNLSLDVYAAVKGKLRSRPRTPVCYACSARKPTGMLVVNTASVHGIPRLARYT